MPAWPKAPGTGQSHCGAGKGLCTDPPAGPLLQGRRCYILLATAPQAGQPQPQQRPPLGDGASGPDGSRTRPEALPRSPARPAPPGSEQTRNETEPTGTFSKPGAVRSKADTTQVGVRGKPDGPGGSAAPGPPRCVALPLGPGPAALRIQPRAGLCAQREKDFTAKE